MKREADHNPRLKSSMLTLHPCHGRKCMVCSLLVVEMAFLSSLTEISPCGWFTWALHFLRNIFGGYSKGNTWLICSSDTKDGDKGHSSEREWTKKGPGKQTQPSEQKKKDDTQNQRKPARLAQLWECAPFLRAIWQHISEALKDVYTLVLKFYFYDLPLRNRVVSRA